MDTLIKTTAIKSETSDSGKMTTPTGANTNSTTDTSHISTDVQSYLISNYRDALKKGDKSAAKSCLLAARYFSVNDPNVTNEIYIMAKSDGDVNEASKCFANIFNDLFLNKSQSPAKTQSNELLSVLNQMKEEIKVLLIELSSQYLKLKSVPAPPTLSTLQAQSHNPTPMLSPRLRLSSEDRVASRESVSRLDTHLHSLTKSLFYQQLFESLPEPTKRSILDHAIETTENLFEKCRLMMLVISVFSDSCSTYGSRLLRKLMELSTADQRLDEERQISCVSQASLMCHYAKSLLVLDAIPLVLNIIPVLQLDVDVEELYKTALNFYSEHCLETSAAEYEASELHEGVKKSRLAKSHLSHLEHNSPADEAIEEHLLSTMSLLSQEFINSLQDINEKELQNLQRLSINSKKYEEETASKTDTELLLELVKRLNLKDDIPDDVLFCNKDEGSSSQPVATPPPKSRGRPKKVQQSVIVSVDDVIRKTLLNKSREIQFAFYSIVQHLFIKCAHHLKNSRSRILMNFQNPLANQLETDFSKGVSQRSSRSKSNNSQAIESSGTPTKKQKLESQSNKQLNDVGMEESSENDTISSNRQETPSPSLWSANLCFEFLNSNHGSFTKLWQRFLTSSNAPELNWYRRFSIDQMMMLGQHEKVSELLEIVLDTKKNDFEIKKDHSLNGTSTLTIMTGSPAVSVMELRNLIQLVSCNVQKSDKTKTFDRIDEFINKIRQIGLLAIEESTTNDENDDEYKIVKEKEGLGYLHFDAPSMIRYCIDLFMDILGKFVMNSNIIADTSVGHTIVMSQFDWPRKCALYEHCLTWVRTHKPKSTTPQCLSAATKFTYPEFFQFIHNPNIIEDFMAMLIQGYTLDIKGFNNSTEIIPSNSQTRGFGASQSLSVTSSRGQSSGSTTRSGKAITTRGVNKSFKEDLKVALIAQMKSSTLITPLDTVCEFIQSSLIPFLTIGKK